MRITKADRSKWGQLGGKTAWAGLSAAARKRKIAKMRAGVLRFHAAKRAAKAAAATPQPQPATKPAAHKRVGRPRKLIKIENALVPSKVYKARWMTVDTASGPQQVLQIHMRDCDDKPLVRNYSKVLLPLIAV